MSDSDIARLSAALERGIMQARTHNIRRVCLYIHSAFMDGLSQYYYNRTFFLDWGASNLAELGRNQQLEVLFGYVVFPMRETPFLAVIGDTGSYWAYTIDKDLIPRIYPWGLPDYWDLPSYLYMYPPYGT